MTNEFRAKILYSVTAGGSFLLLLWMVWALRSLIVPTIVGGLIAYMFIPLLNFFKRKGFPDAIAVLMLLGVFMLGVLILSMQIRSIIPDENGKLVLRIRIQYKLDEKYREYMGTHGDGKGNLIYNLVGKELDPILHDVLTVLKLDHEESIQVEAYFEKYKGRKPQLVKYLNYYKVMEQYDTQKEIEKLIEESQSVQEIPEKPKEKRQFLSKIGEAVSVWLMAPFVFLFLLIDQGIIKKSLVSMVPNKYFEVVLTIIDNVDEAIGKYLRGTLLECSLVGLTFIVCLTLIGIEFEWAIIIGIIAGMANAIPFLGPAIGLVVGMTYALIAEDMTPILPFIDPQDIVIWVLITVGIAQALDNVVFQPIVLGSAVSLHPLVVIFGVMGGSIIFGFAGMLFAIPAIVIVKVIFSTLFTELRAYNLI